ncbi:MAG TPA: HAD family hydrolase [Phototrophicaceae bacterium]|nr:HAD family hydrolase [Phototrophicaceae bacterium]
MSSPSHPTYELFIFDFDGTLADSRHNITNSLNYALRSIGLAEVDPSRIYPLIGKLTLEATFSYFYPALTAAEIAHLLQTFRQYQRDHIRLELAFFPEAISTLAALKNRNKRLAILTTKHIEQIEYILAAFDLRRLFDVVCGEGLPPQRKPDPACVEFILAAVGTSIARPQAVMVGDSEVDVRTAQNGGIDMIAVAHGTDSLEYLKHQGATYTVQSLSELLLFA